MKKIPKWVTFAVVALVYVCIAALSKYDVNNNSWPLAIIVWLAGTALLIKWTCKRLKIDLEKEESKDGSVDYLSLALSFGVTFALTAVIFAVGLTSSFGFSTTYSLPPNVAPSFLGCIANGLLLIGALLITLSIAHLATSYIFCAIIAKVWAYFYCGDGYDLDPHSAGLPHTSFLGVGFLVLSHICGIINVFSFITYVSSIISRFQ